MNPFPAPTPSGSVVSVCNRCVLDEWSRLATAAYRAGYMALGHKFSAAAATPEGAQVDPVWFDKLQDIYRAWLVFGWDNALPAFTAAFPAPSPAEPVKVLPSPSVVPVEVPAMPDTLLIGDYRRNIGIDSDTRLTFEAGEDVALRTTVGEVIGAISSHAAHLAKIQALTEAAQKLVDWYDGDSDESHPIEGIRAALALPSA